MPREPRTSNLEPARNFIRAHLSRSLSAATPEDRLSAAWTVACGRAMAARSHVASYDAAAETVRIGVTDPAWLEPLSALRSKLIRDLASGSGLPVRQLDLHLSREPRAAS